MVALHNKMLLVMITLFAVSVKCFGADVDQIVKGAEERTRARTGKQTIWTGPAASPAAAKGKKIVCINADSKNAVEALWGKTTSEAAKKIGWEIVVLDGKGTVQGQVAALNQAISMQVDGIVMSANAEPLQASLQSAKEQGIPVVGIHASNVPGPNPDLNLRFNCTTSGTEIGKAMADFVIADSKGKGRAIILYDAQYAIAREKAEAMRAQLATCPTVEVLDYVNSPLSEVAKNMPQLTSTWIARYGTPFYVLSIADYFFDFATPTLRAGGVPAEDVKLLGADGIVGAYQRIRTDDYQIVTIPEPSTMFGYMSVDALNRIFNGEEVADFIPDVYIVTADNVDEEGGTQNMFVPSNDFESRYLKMWGIE